MNNNAFCPISYHKINENVARLNGLFTVILLAVFLVTSNVLPVLFLLVDFLLRGIERSSWSPLAIVSKFILSKLKVAPHLINAGPKIFAARIGLLFSLLISISVVFNLEIGAIVLAFVFGSCAFMEAAFNYCVACKFYPFFYRLVYQSNYKKGHIKSDFQI